MKDRGYFKQEYWETNFNRLVEKITEDSFIIFIGAGISNLSGYPLASELPMEIIKNDAFDNDVYQIIKKAELEPIDKLSWLFKEKQELTINIIKQIFQVKYPINERMKSVLQRLSVVTKDMKLITTNLDKSLLEIMENYSYKVRPDFSKPLLSSNIYFLHGIVDNESSWVLTKRDYHSKYDKKMNEFVSYIFSEHNILFLGYSLRDYEILQNIFRIKDTLNGTERFYFMGFDSGNTDQNIIRSSILKDTYGININGNSIITEKNTMIVSGNGLDIEYINNKKGMRQNFIVNERPEGNGKLELSFAIEGNNTYQITPDEITFKSNNQTVMEYKDLYIYDSKDNELDGRFIKTDNGFKILISDTDAKYPITIDPLSTTPDWIGESNQEDANYGISVSSAGDVNGDGYSDVIVGAQLYDNGQTDEGAAFVYYGDSTGLSTTHDWMGEGNQVDAYYGRSVSSAGDVNGDGYSDVIVGADAYENGETNEGAAFVYYGSSSGLDTIPDWIGEINQEDANYGISVSSAGDVNGDGYSDIIVGAYHFDNGETDEGAAFVYHGSETGLPTTHDWMGKSNEYQAFYGVSVSSAGDVNGDGYSDVIVGAHFYTNGQRNEGAAFVYYGDSTGLSTTHDWMRESNQEDSNYGVSVSSAGDVNGDGYSDVIVGAHYASEGQLEEGAAFVYHGSGAGLSTTHDWMGESNQMYALYGISVSTAGDVNGDGYSDVIVGASEYDNGEGDEGAAFVYYGSGTGLSTTHDWMGESNRFMAYYGVSVSSAGDVNADGNDDIIIGANMYDKWNGVINEGAAFVYYGKDDVPPSSFALISPIGYISGNTPTYIWESSSDVHFAGYELYVDDSLIITQTDTTYTEGVGLSDGKYEWYVVASDSFGNETESNSRDTFMVDTTPPSVPVLVSPIDGDTLHSATLIWNLSSDNYSGVKEYDVEYDTDSLFSSPTSQTVIDTTYSPSLTDGVYYWRVMSRDSNDNESSWSEADSFIAVLEMPELILSLDNYDFGNIEIDRLYNCSELYLKNIGNANLSIDSIIMTETKYILDSSYSYPLTIIPSDSMNITLNVQSSDTGTTPCLLKIYHNEPGVVYDSVVLTSYCGIPTIIDSAIAYDGTNTSSGIDDDDFVNLFFNQSTNGVTINATNIDSILMLSGGHSWLDGFGSLDSTSWNPAKSVLRMDLSTNTQVPDISVGDTIYPDSSSVVGDLNGFVCHYPVVLTGSFGPSGIADKILNDALQKKLETSLSVNMSKSQIMYSVKTKDNQISIYDITGKLLKKTTNSTVGQHTLELKDYSSGIYFIKVIDGETELSDKIVKIK